jgi:uncharacterized protein (TIGR03546 family)
LVPKDNLLAAALAVLLCVLRLNLGMAALAALAFSWVGLLTDPLTHRLGYWLLTQDALRPLWTTLAGLPVVPWTRFNNTVVLGSFLAGLALAWPLYRLSRPRFAVWVPHVGERLRRYRWCRRLLDGAALTGRLREA